MATIRSSTCRVEYPLLLIRSFAKMVRVSS